MKFADYTRPFCFYAILGGLFLLAVLACQKEPDAWHGKSHLAKPAAEPTDSLFKLRFLPQWTHQAQFAGVYMAEKKGFYRSYGLDVQILPGGADAPSYDNLQSGKTDITQLFLITAMTRDAENRNLVNLAQISQKSALMLVGKKDQGIRSQKDMNGRSLGLWRSDFRDLSLIYLKQNKLNMDIVNVDFTINLFLNNAIDMINVMRYNEYHRILQAGIDPDDLFTINFSEEGLNIIEDGLYCTRAYYNRYPEQCKRFAEATLDGWVYAINHQEETLETVLNIMRRHHIPANKPHQAWMLQEMRNVFMARPSEIGILRKTDFELVKNLLIEQNNPVTPQSYESFYPNGR